MRARRGEIIKDGEWSLRCTADDDDDDDDAAGKMEACWALSSQLYNQIS